MATWNQILRGIDKSLRGAYKLQNIAGPKRAATGRPATYDALLIGTNTVGRPWKSSTSAPVITSSANQTIAENSPFGLLLTADQSVVWSIIGGADQSTFAIATDTLGATAFDFETPLDSDHNNTYLVTVRATNTVSGLYTDQTITVTVTNAVEDTTPDAFAFTDVSGASLSTVYTSNAITVTGIDGPAAISVTGGTYSVNGGAYVSSSGTVNNGDTVTVRTTSSASNSAAVSVVLTIGGVSDTYTVTTVAAAGGAAYSFVQGQYAAKATGSAQAFATANTAGNAIIVAAAWNGTGTPTISDTKGNSYTLVKKQSDASDSVGVWAAFGCGAGANSVTLTLAGANFDACFLEYHGLVAVDQTSGANQSTGTTPSSGNTASTTQANEMVFGFIGANGGNPQAGTSFTSRANGVNNYYVRAEDKRVTATGAYAADFTMASATARTICATFKEG